MQITLKCSSRPLCKHRDLTNAANSQDGPDTTPKRAQGLGGGAAASCHLWGPPVAHHNILPLNRRISSGSGSAGCDTHLLVTPPGTGWLDTATADHTRARTCTCSPTESHRIPATTLCSLHTHMKGPPLVYTDKQLPADGIRVKKKKSKGENAWPKMVLPCQKSQPGSRTALQEENEIGGNGRGKANAGAPETTNRLSRLPSPRSCVSSGLRVTHPWKATSSFKEKYFSAT